MSERFSDIKFEEMKASIKEDAIKSHNKLNQILILKCKIQILN